MDGKVTSPVTDFQPVIARLRFCTACRRHPAIRWSSCPGRASRILLDCRWPPKVPASFKQAPSPGLQNPAGTRCSLFHKPAVAEPENALAGGSVPKNHRTSLKSSYPFSYQLLSAWMLTVPKSRAFSCAGQESSSSAYGGGDNSAHQNAPDSSSV